MEGTLWKWTNYWHGWQPRWFVLEDGVLQYYHSHEQMGQGCKGSIRLTSCDIMVHPQEETRIDLIVAPDRYFYLHASSPAERQRWLVALGSAKAAHATNLAIAQRQVTSVSACRLHLRQQCQTILRNVDKVQNYVNGNSDEKKETITQDLQTSCDHFIHALEESMNFAEARVPQLKTTLKHSPSSSQHTEGSTKINKEDLRSVNNSPQIENNLAEELAPFTPSESTLSKFSEPECPKVREVQTFFSTMTYSFLHVQMEDDNLIPTLPFLDAASSLTTIFDLLGPTLFAPVKNDMTGNIQKLKESHNLNPEKHKFLQTMILQEVESDFGRTATSSLLWLKRGLEFMHVFLRNHLEGCGNLALCASQAYEKTLKPYHGWIVRGLFKVIVRGLPTKEVFLTGLAPSPEDRCHPKYESQLYEDLQEFISSLEKCTSELSSFYASHGLDDPAKV